jgi:hypothetical protein
MVGSSLTGYGQGVDDEEWAVVEGKGSRREASRRATLRSIRRIDAAETGGGDMKRIRITGICLVVVFVMGAVAASASAEAPEFGRCLKTQVGGGTKYTTAKCTVVASGEKEIFEWYSAFGGSKPLEKAGFATKLKPETIATLETIAGSKITCKGETSGGKYTGNKTVGGVVLKFTSCESGGGKCNSAGKGAGEITWNELDGVLGIWKTGETKVQDKAAISLKPTTGEELVEFFCGGLVIKLKGSLLLPVPANAMKLSATVKFTAAKGKQKPEKFVEGPQEVPECKFAAAPYEKCGLTIALIQTNEEKVEASTVL